jgi:hypothetical protein
MYSEYCWRKMRWDRNKAVHRYMPVHRCTGTKYHDFQKVKLGKGKEYKFKFPPHGGKRGAIIERPFVLENKTTSLTGSTDRESNAPNQAKRY